MEKITRRNLFKLIAGAVAVPYTAIFSAKDVVAEVDFGFTWGKVSAPNLAPGFDEVIRTTLRNNRKKLAENISKNNSVLLKLQQNKYIKVNKIDPKVQEQRMIERITAKKVALTNPNNAYSDVEIYRNL